MRHIAFLICLLLCLAVSPGNAYAATAPPSYQINGLDTHDGDLVQVGNTYYMYGTRYGCGFTWGNANTMWCGFGTFSSTDMIHWTDRSLLFDPFGQDTWNGLSWQATCRSYGCFNPRMVQRSWDGKWILYFNAPGDYARTRANAYYAIGCDGPAGPCRDEIHKPAMYICYDNGDFAITADGSGAYIVCTMTNQSLNIEKLDMWWTNGIDQGATDLTQAINVESPGVIADPKGSLVLTYSEPNCGYCSGTGTAAKFATSMTGPYSNRFQLSTTSCGGQPRTAVYINGQAYEWIDQWYGSYNETNANVRLEPILFNANGTIVPFSC